MVDAYWHELYFTMELLILLPFLNNVVMAAIKTLFARWFKSEQVRNPRLRLVLLLLSLGGYLADRAINGELVDANVVGQSLLGIVTVLGIMVASHFTYKVIKS